MYGGGEFFGAEWAKSLKASEWSGKRVCLEKSDFLIVTDIKGMCRNMLFVITILLVKSRIY